MRIATHARPDIGGGFEVSSMDIIYIYFIFPNLKFIAVLYNVILKYKYQNYDKSLRIPNILLFAMYKVYAEKAN